MEITVNNKPLIAAKALSGTGYDQVETNVLCVLTRFQLRSAWWLIPFYLHFRRVRRAARDIKGLLKTLFLIEDPHTCYTLSMWEHDAAVLEFGTRIHAHVAAANFAFGPTWCNDLKRPEIWSAEFRLSAVSPYNLNWQGIDLRAILGSQSTRVQDEEQPFGGGMRS